MKGIISAIIAFILILILGTVFTLSLIPREKSIVVKENNNVTLVRAMPYGVFNPEDKAKNVEYKISPASVVLLIVFSESIVIPLVVVGWFLYEPVSAIQK